MQYRFGPFQVDDEDFQLSSQGREIALEPRAFHLLLYFVRHPGRLLRKQELLDKVWSDANVSENSLARCVTQVRKALEEDSRDPLYLATVPTAGYRFMAQVETREAYSNAPKTDAVPKQAIFAVASTLPHRPSRLGMIVGSSVLAALLAVGFGQWFRSNRTYAATPIHSLAVLPLENLSGDPGQEYFADGMTDELTTELAGIPNLRVVSRTSAMTEKGSHKTLQRIASDLNVDAIVEGSVIKSNSKVRITAQLIDARNDKHLWAQSFEGSSTDIVSLQGTVAREIAEHAKVALAPAFRHGDISPAVNLAAYDALLRGRYFYAKQDLIRSAKYFDQAIAADRNYAPAYAGLADALEAETTFGLIQIDEGMPRALAAAQHAIALDSENGEAYESLGSIETIYEWNWRAAESDLNRSLALNPNFPVVEMKDATYLDAVGSTDEAERHMRRALSLDPMSFYMTRRLGATLYLARDYDGALQQLRRAAEMEPDQQASVDPYLVVTYEQKGMHDQAVDADLQLLHSTKPSLDVMKLHSVYRLQGWQAYWRARIQALKPYANQFCAAYDLGLSYIRIGNRDRAFSSLNRAIDERCFQVVLLKTDPVLDQIRSEKRFESLLQRVHLSER